MRKSAVIVIANECIDLVNQMIEQKNCKIAAIVAQDRIFAIQNQCPPDITFSFWELKDAVEKFSPDYVLFFLPRQTPLGSFYNQLKEIEFPISHTGMMSIYSDDEVLTHKRMLRDFSKEPQKYKIIATGNSKVYFGIRPEEFELPIWNFAYYSQDFYYDYQIVKRAFGIEDTIDKGIGIDVKVAPPPRV